MKLNTVSLKDVEVGIPVIADGLYHARIRVQVKPNKSGTGNNLKVQAQILEPEVMTHDGKLVKNVGNLHVFRHISLVPTDNYDPNRMLKELQIAANLPEEEDLTEEVLQGVAMLVKVAYKPAEASFSEGNDIKGFSPIKSDDVFDLASVPF